MGMVRQGECGGFEQICTFILLLQKTMRNQKSHFLTFCRRPNDEVSISSHLPITTQFVDMN
jgi:hypothetical protein